MPEINDHSTHDVDTYNKSSWELLMHNPSDALNLAQEAFSKAKDVSYLKGQADALLNIGWSHHYLSRLPESFQSFVDAQRLYESLGNVLGLCMTANAFGVYYYFTFRLDKSMDFYRKSLELAKTNHILDRELIALVNLGELCLELDNYKDALDYLIPAYGRMTKSMPTEAVAECLRNIGKAFLSMQNPVMAEAYTRKS